MEKSTIEKIAIVLLTTTCAITTAVLGKYSSDKSKQCREIQSKYDELISKSHVKNNGSAVSDSSSPQLDEVPNPKNPRDITEEIQALNQKYQDLEEEKRKMSNNVDGINQDAQTRGTQNIEYEQSKLIVQMRQLHRDFISSKLEKIDSVTREREFRIMEEFLNTIMDSLSSKRRINIQFLREQIKHLNIEYEQYVNDVKDEIEKDKK